MRKSAFAAFETHRPPHPCGARHSATDCPQPPI
jgi:hypothetical protein